MSQEVESYLKILNIIKISQLIYREFGIGYGLGVRY